MSTNNTSSLDTDPVIDWELGMKLAGDKLSLAKEMLQLLVKSLPAEMNDILIAKEANDYPTLAKRLHKLHGAICYCGVPRLKKAIITLEKAVKQNDTATLPALFASFQHELTQLLQQAAQERD